MKILGTGLSGLIGSRIIDLLKDRYEFENLSISTGFDITQKQTAEDMIISSDASIVLHLASKTDVDRCEKEKEQGINSVAWRVNVEGTRNIAEACQKSRKKIIYFSTDFVFDGEKEEPYVEEDKPDPINWYAKTKFEGEKIIKSSGIPYLILRIAYPYRSKFEKKSDFVRTILKRLKEKQPITAIYDHIITPTFIDDIAEALDILIKNGSDGGFHVVGSQYVSPYDAALLIADLFGYDKSLIQKITRAEYFENKASRPFHLALKNDKIEKLGIKMKTFEQGLLEIQKQMKEL
jgi:dTDP-4-dehydrorhamnose reductase